MGRLSTAQLRGIGRTRQARPLVLDAIPSETTTGRGAAAQGRTAAVGSSPAHLRERGPENHLPLRKRHFEEIPRGTERSGRSLRRRDDADGKRTRSIEPRGRDRAQC